MKNIALTFLLLALAPTFAQAALNLQPGLWQVQLQITSDGKTVSPQAELAKAMAKMTPEQRQRMQAMLAKGSGGAQFSPQGMRICLTQELLNDPRALHADPEHRCETKIKEQSPARVAMSFKCKDGATGDGEWLLDNRTTYHGQMHMTRPGGKKTDIQQSGKFISASCGEVKPYAFPARTAH